jgi:hypothetical protein
LHQHSVTASQRGNSTVFDAPDVVYIHDRQGALNGARLYIGDGATLNRSLIRRRGRRLIGHASINMQLDWCKKEGVPRVIISHCGSQIVAAGEKKARAELASITAKHGVDAQIAYDGMELVLR